MSCIANYSINKYLQSNINQYLTFSSLPYQWNYVSWQTSNLRHHANPASIRGWYTGVQEHIFKPNTNINNDDNAMSSHIQPPVHLHFLAGNRSDMAVHKWMVSEYLTSIQDLWITTNLTCDRMNSNMNVGHDTYTIWQSKLFASLFTDQYY